MCGSLEIDSAIDTVKLLSRDLAEAKREAKEGRLLPLPGESVESCALELGATSKTVGSSMAQLLTAANQGEHLLDPSTLWVVSQYPLGHISVPSESYPSTFWVPSHHIPVSSGSHSSTLWVTFQYPLGHIPVPSGSHSSTLWITFQYPLGHIPVPTSPHISCLCYRLQYTMQTTVCIFQWCSAVPQVLLTEQV